MFLLDDDEDAVVLAVEERQLSLAFDIASPGSGRRDLRVWRDSLQALLHREIQPRAESLEAVRAIVTGFFPESTVAQRQLSNVFSCSSSHITNLVERGALALAGERPSHSHALAATRITRASVVDFLCSRWA